MRIINVQYGYRVRLRECRQRNKNENEEASKLFHVFSFVNDDDYF